MTKQGFNFIEIEVTELQEVQFKILCFLTSSCKAQASNAISCKVLQCCSKSRKGLAEYVTFSGFSLCQHKLVFTHISKEDMMVQL